MKKKKLNKVTYCIVGMSLIFVSIGIVYYKVNYKVPLKEYTKYALYMAVLDDEICRNELEGIDIDGKEVVFPEKKESLQYRYHLFLEMNKGKTKKQIEDEVKQLEIRLQESRNYENKK